MRLPSSNVAPTNTPPLVPSERATVLHHALLIVAVIAVLSLAWTGFIASDDEDYAAAGLGWLHEFPYVAQGFASLRTVTVLPIAATVGLFGEREFSVVLSTCIFLALTASLTLAMLSRFIGVTAALIACSLMVTIPLLALTATIPSADLPELFFVAGSFWLFWTACRQEPRAMLLFLSGIAAALAFSAHEVTMALLLFYGVLFVVGYRIPRAQYRIIAGGFLLIIGLECTYYLAMTGEPLHRFKLLLLGVVVHDRVEVGFLDIASGGTLHVWDPIDPIVMFFTQHDLGALAFFAVPAMWSTLKRRAHQSPANTAARLLILLGLIWFLFSAIALRNLVLLPRYYMVSAYCVFVVTAIWAAQLWRSHRKAVTFGATTFLLINMAAIAADNKDPRFGERALVEYLRESSGPVYTDPMTAAKAKWYCRWAGQDSSRILANAPPKGGVYAFNPKNLQRPHRLLPPESVRLFTPCTSWPVIFQRTEPEKWPGRVLDHLGLASRLPTSIYRRLSTPNPSLIVFRADSPGGACVEPVLSRSSPTKPTS